MAIAVLLPLASEAYVWLAYEESHVEEFALEDFSGYVVNGIGRRIGSRPARELRWDWLPGSLYVFEETCLRCMNNGHEQCDQEQSVAFDWTDETRFKKQYDCACSHLSHRNKPHVSLTGYRCTSAAGQ